jgi:hypothetical protein
MRLRRIACFGFVALALAPSAWAQDLNFRAVAPARRAPFVEPIPISVGRPQPITQTSAAQSLQPTFRAQMGPEVSPPINVPPPPPYPGGGVGGPVRPTPFAGAPGAPKSGVHGNEEDYNCGRVNNDADTGGFFTRTGDQLSRCWYDITQGVSGGFGGSSGRAMFQSDNCFNGFISPVTNPHLFEDPRALTELRPVFMWQKTPDSNYVYQGSNNFFADIQARVALTQNISLVVNRLGWVWSDVANPLQGIQSGNGFSEINLGPKFTFIRNETSGTVAALGLNFILPTGAAQVNQNTGNLSLAPYFSIAQNFGRTDYGSFNFMNTTGYSLGVDSLRTDFVYASFHLDFDIADAHKFYPLVELNWTYYTFNGSSRDVGFEGNNLVNYGSAGVAGHSDLTLALGGRYKVSEHFQLGLAGEMNVLGGSRHLDLFRLTFDVIFRY